MGDQDLAGTLGDQGYQIVGKHSAVKLCYWTRQSLVNGRDCYKGRFYGIESHRCLQMSPAIDSCNLHCRFCWRNQGWENDTMIADYDDPELLLQKSIDAQRRILSGFKGEESVSEERWNESQSPRHIAISLTGEPTLYPKMNRFLELCHERGITTFLVTNGTEPGRAPGPRPAAHPTVCIGHRPQSGGVPSAHVAGRRPRVGPAPGVPRDPPRPPNPARGPPHPRPGLEPGVGHEYAELDLTARPDFVEPKGYVYMGRSRQRLGRDHVPAHDEIGAFARELSERTGYRVLDESPESKVFLLGHSNEGRYLPGHAPEAADALG